MVRLPDFLVVGAAKSGTTALHRYLSGHPQIYLSPHEEPSFFAFEGEPPRFRGPAGIEPAVNRHSVTRLADYVDLFQEATDGQRIGDVSPNYLYWPAAPDRIRHYIPHAKICVILRNPADRAYSSFMHAQREAREPIRDFEEALREEPRRIDENYGFLWRYADMSFYAPQLRRYYARFPKDQIKVVLHDDLSRDAQGLCSALAAFIGVDPDFDWDVSLRHNVSGIPRSRILHSLLGGDSRLGKTARAAVPESAREHIKGWQVRLRSRNLRPLALDEDQRRRLLNRFREDIAEVESLIGRDLRHWLPADSPG